MTPLLLLPGMMCDARLFQPQVAALSGHVPLMTAPIGQADSMVALAQSILQIAPPRFAVAGLSLGGILAMELIRQAPERILGAALMDTNPLSETPEVQARRGPQMAAARAGRLEQVMRDEMKPNYLTEGPNRAQILDLCMAMAIDLGPEVFINQSKALRDRPDQCETLRQFARPTLVLCGRDDALCPPHRHELMHELLPQSHLEILDGAGHLPTLETPDQTTAALRRWLESL
ncbi:alpha/beta hydrolase domain-containing protein [Phaeobacter piscinae]|uniref:Alpha/beta hydrolase domain-containing protein n=1 Tax=Phaeobacter piscinae TaxID=1580596 RepID=A0AAN1GSU4_9RHOB|nr:alpha/beta fold hydrolase [Phaeobacter piscinae]ATG44438.1 alpha/beta hydrolase domain-containing protein [Phaeobacter piscinae]AUR36752.1 alpha/beta hydrolase domain-containing protein [Phaeobacter piscinae]